MLSTGIIWGFATAGKGSALSDGDRIKAVCSRVKALCVARLSQIRERIGWSYGISERELQRSLDRSFPLTGSTPLGRWALSQPRVGIEDDAQLSLVLALGVGRRAVEAPLGNIHLRGLVTYSLEQGAFYIEQVRVLGFGAGNWEGALLPLRMAAEQGLRVWFSANPVFRFDQARRSHMLLRRWLVHVHTRKGRLMLRLGVSGRKAGRGNSG